MIDGELKRMTAAGTVQIRVICALILREMRVRFGRSQLGYLWAVAEPLAHVTVLSSLFYFIGRHPPVGNSMPLFFATGILPFILFRNLGNQLAGAFDANQTLMTYPIVQPVDTILARTALEVATVVFIALIVLTGLILLTGAPPPNNLFRMAEAVLLLTLYGFGIGFLNAVIIRQIPSWQNMFRMGMMPMMFISGIFFSLESLPPHLRDILAWNPVLHGVELFRSGYYPVYRASGLDPAYLLWCGLITTLIAFAAERTLRGRSER